MCLESINCAQKTNKMKRVQHQYIFAISNSFMADLFHGKSNIKPLQHEMKPSRFFTVPVKSIQVQFEVSST